MSSRTIDARRSSIGRARIDLRVTPLEALRGFRGRERVVALMGQWHQGEVLIAADPAALATDPFDVDLPRIDDPEAFGGGWIGAWGYRLGSRIESVRPHHMRPVPQPEHRIGFYDRVLRFSGGTWWAETLDSRHLDDWVREVEGLMLSASAEVFEVGAFAMVPDPREHQAAVAKALDHIRAGDIFQVNLCARLEAAFSGDPLDLFCAGVETLRPAYAAFVTSPEGSIASFSPELFLRRTQRDVLTSPIKGTAPLSTDPSELLASAKNRAENTMIVDLMRNDLSRVCVPGSVRVPAINRLEQHAVWHLVSDVVGELQPGKTDEDLLRATFPPGSVTGAPKVESMKIIGELEATARETYTGAIGHVSPAAGLEMNVAIRTFEIAEGRVWLGAGGGIVADSDPAEEYAECLTKARPLIEAIGGLLPSDLPVATPVDPKYSSAKAPAIDRNRGVFETLLVVDGIIVDLDRHWMRLDSSIRSLYGSTLPNELRQEIRQRAEPLRGRHRLRLGATPQTSGMAFEVSVGPVGTSPAEWHLEIRVIQGGMGDHKWADRRRVEQEVHPDRDLLLVDTDGSVLETSRANIFCVADDGIHTPVLDGRLLPGTQRQRTIEKLESAGFTVFQRRLTVADLARAHEVFATNALREVIPVTRIGGVGSWQIGPISDFLRSTDSSGASTATENHAVALKSPPRVLLIDNYDSFVYNLAHYVSELGAQAEVVRNDAATVDELLADDFSHVIISPGPGQPSQAGISKEAIARFGRTTPVLGVCLGHQAIGEVYGARIVRSPRAVHGKPSLVHHQKQGVFAGLASPVAVARYHSLMIAPETLPAELEITARNASGIIMGIRHRTFPVEGIQVHPESILTSYGHAMLRTFLDRTPQRPARKLNR